MKSESENAYKVTLRGLNLRLGTKRWSQQGEALDFNKSTGNQCIVV